LEYGRYLVAKQGTATVTVTTGVVIYCASATLQFNTASERTATDEELNILFAFSYILLYLHFKSV
jgi:hypothetical protein